jgi:hypothetical protein
VDASTVSLLVSDAGASVYRPEHADLIADASVLREALSAAAQATDADTLLDHYARLADKHKGVQG